MTDQYIIRDLKNIEVRRQNGDQFIVPASIMHNAVGFAHEVIDKFKDFGVDVFSILGMRNLSAFIGELYSAAAIKCSNNLFRKNPHQDGYPDMLLMDKAGLELWASLQSRSREKGPFSPFATGGIEVKATCGSVPTPAESAKRGLLKPDIGDQRISVMKGYDWKAHHRETNNLAGLLWDFIDGVPRIVAVFYSCGLTTADWGEIIQPKEGGGRTTSVSIMNRTGVRRMYEGWLLVRRDPRYIAFIDRYNSGGQLNTASNSVR